jgi:PAS domain S-box-containing protein
MKEMSRNERKAHFLETINAFGSIIMRKSTAQESAWCVAKHAVGELGYIDCIIYLINDDGELYQCAAHGNKNPTAQDVLNPIKLKMGEGVCGHVALTGVGEIIADTSKDPRYIVDDEDRYSEITVPIVSDGIVIGIIDSEHPKKGYFSDHDLNILNTIASMLSFKISQAKAIEQLAITNKELAFQNEEKQKRADELVLANKEYAFQNEEKQKRADELVLANKELAFQNKEEEKRADKLAIAITKLTFENEEKQKRADELAIAITRLAFQNKEKEKREKKLTLANREKEKEANKLTITIKELAFQNELERTRIETESIAKELRQFIETANAPIFGIDNKGLVNEWNHTSEKITGFKKEDVLGKNLVKNYITKNYQVAVKKVLDNALKGKETANYEFPLFTKSGKRIMVLLNSSTRRNVDGKVIGVIGVGQDITQMDKLRTESESVAKELRQFIETANAPIFGIDSKGLVNEWNQTSEKITGFKKEDVLGKDMLQTYITEDYQESVKKVLHDALKGKETANYQFPLFTKEGARVMVLLNSSTRRNAEGKIVGVLGVGQDITQMDKLRTESESVAKELRQFIETANAPIFGIDSKGLVNEWNQTSEKITGFKKEDVLGKDLVQTYITEDYKEAVKKVLDDALKGKETANYEFPLFTKEGARIMVLLNSSTRRNADGKIVGVLGVGQDITILNEYKENLESKVKERTHELEDSLEREKELGLLKTSFVSTASHQFRTPLTAIQSNAELLEMFARLSGKEEEKKYKEVTRRITGEIAKMTELMDYVLILGKLTSGNVHYSTHDVDLVDFCKKLAKEFDGIQSNGRGINVRINGKPYNVHLDPKLLTHSLSNLISNAFKYSVGKDNPELTIHFKPKEFVLSIKDYGIGIPKGELKKLFQPFFRAENVIDIKGTGLGLSIAKEYIEINKGHIEAQSILGEGSCFEIKFKR